MHWKCIIYCVWKCPLAARVSWIPDKVESIMSFKISPFPDTIISSVISGSSFHLFTLGQLPKAAMQWFRTSTASPGDLYEHIYSWVSLMTANPLNYELFVLRTLHRDWKAWGIELFPLELYRKGPTLVITVISYQAQAQQPVNSQTENCDFVGMSLDKLH